MDWEAIESIVYSEEDHPDRILGAHKVKNGILVHTFLPDAVSVQLKVKSTGKCYDMEEADEAGLFAVLLPGKKQNLIHLLQNTMALPKLSWKTHTFIQIL